MPTKSMIAVSPEEVGRWLEDYGPGGHGDPYEGMRTDISVDDAEKIAMRVAEAAMADDPEARSVDFSFVREALLLEDYHLALSDRLEPFVSAAFGTLKQQAKAPTPVAVQAPEPHLEAASA